MKRIGLVVAGLSIAGPALAQEEVTRILLRDVEVTQAGDVKVYASFRSGQDAPVTRLDPQKLAVEVDGQRVGAGDVIATPFSATEEGVAVLIEIDTSASMRHALPRIQEAIQEYVRTLRRGRDYSAVGAIGDDWRLVSDFTADPDVTARAIGTLRATDRTTALFESVYEGVAMLARRGSDIPSRRLVVVVSDGLNEKRGRTPRECVEAGNRAHVQVHSFIFLARRDEAYLEAKGELETISRDTGGMTFTTSDPSDMKRATHLLVEEVAREMVLVIAGSAVPQDGREHDLTIRYEPAVARTKFLARLGPGPEAEAIPEKSEEGEKKVEEPAIGRPVTDEPWFFPAVGGLVLLLAAGGFVWLRARKARREALQREAAWQEEIRSKTEEVERLRAEAAQKASEPQVAAVQPVVLHQTPPPPKRKTEYRAPEAEVGMVTRLRPVRGIEGVSVLELPQGDFSIGYDLSNEVVLNADTVSGRHARIVTTASGRAVMDLGSTNGTFVDGVRVGRDPVALGPGSELRLGLVVFRCE